MNNWFQLFFYKQPCFIITIPRNLLVFMSHDNVTNQARFYHRLRTFNKTVRIWPTNTELVPRVSTSMYTYNSMYTQLLIYSIYIVINIKTYTHTHLREHTHIYIYIYYGYCEQLPIYLIYLYDILVLIFSYIVTNICIQVCIIYEFIWINEDNFKIGPDKNTIY